MNNQHYKHCDTVESEEKNLTLHDCISDKVDFSDGKLTFYFDEGFWISPEHPANNLENTVRTDAAKVEYILGRGDSNDVFAYVFTKNILGQTVRNVWELEEIIERINSGNCKIEFIYQYKDLMARIVECSLIFKMKPYHAECMLRMNVSGVNYYWNNLCEEKSW